jgi:hypothetical protein
MKLDRNNYEEYFLMYADGELAQADRQLVENFVKLHPDLGDELDMLLEAVLDIDANITMPNKNLLYKNIEWAEESLTPQQKDLLLYVDNELPATQKLVLEGLLRTDKALQQDLASLENAKLMANAVEMPEKEDLYRKENNRRLIPIVAFRWMAAAAVIAGLGWFSFSVFTTQTNIETPSLASSSVKKEARRASEITTPNAPASKNLGLQHSSTATSSQVDLGLNNSKSAAVASEVKTARTNGGQVNLSSQSATNKEASKQSNIDPLPIASTTALSTSTEKVLPSTTTVLNTGNVSNPLAELAAKHHIEPNVVETISNVDIASLPPSKDEITEETEYVNIAGARIKKQKVRGLFRSVTRTVGRAFDKSNVAQADVATLK